MLVNERNEFMYDTLPDLFGSTRILTLIPETESTVLNRELETISLQAPQTYVALSYEWGRPGDHCQIMVNSVDFTTIPRNLHRFLHQIALQLKSRLP